MDTEIEAKFTDISPDNLRLKLKELGAELVYPERQMRRKVYEHPTTKENDWFRVRDEGDKITMSYKKLNDRTLHGTQEISYTVPDFDQACRFLEAAHLKFVSYQETKRELWKLGDAEITIDTWPWIPTFTELEAKSEETIREIVTKLGLDWNLAIYGSVENVYTKHYNVTEEEVCDWEEITFIPAPEWLISKRK